MILQKCFMYIVVILLMPILMFFWMNAFSDLQIFYFVYNLHVDIYGRNLFMLLGIAAAIIGLFCLAIYVFPYRNELLAARRSPVNPDPYIMLAVAMAATLLVGGLATTFLEYQHTDSRGFHRWGNLSTEQFFLPIVLYVLVYFWGKRKFLRDANAHGPSAVPETSSDSNAEKEFS